MKPRDLDRLQNFRLYMHEGPENALVEVERKFNVSAWVGGWYEPTFNGIRGGGFAFMVPGIDYPVEYEVAVILLKLTMLSQVYGQWITVARTEEERNQTMEEMFSRAVAKHRRRPA